MGKRILIIDDDESFVITLGLLFAYKVFTVINSNPITSNNTAIGMIQFYKPDIILLDHQLSNRGDCGLGVAEIITNEGVGDVLILSTSILVSSSRELTEAYRKTGVIHFPGKTFLGIMKCIEGNCGCYLPAISQSVF